MTAEEAWKQGVRDYGQGIPLSHNPFDEYSADWVLWRAAWRSQQDRDKQLAVA